jgi:hypothetical protein
MYLAEKTAKHENQENTADRRSSSREREQKARTTRSHHSLDDTVTGKL